WRPLCAGSPRAQPPGFTCRGRRPSRGRREAPGARAFSAREPRSLAEDDGVADNGNTMRRLVAVLIAPRAPTNLGKPFRAGAGFVILGRLRHGLAATVVAPVFGVAMLVYAALLFRGHPAARPLAVIYAVWATVNVVLFPFLEGVPSRFAP